MNFNLQKIKEYLLYFFVFFLPFQTRWIISGGEVNEYSNISLYGSDIFLIVILILSLIIFYQDKKEDKKILFFKESYWLWLSGFEFLVFISIFIAPVFSLALYSYFKIIFSIGLFAVLIYAKYDQIKLLLALLINALLQSGLAIWQFFSQNFWENKWLGLAAHDPTTLGTAVIELNGERWLRVYGGLDHPNILGGFLVLVIFFTLINFNNLVIFFKKIFSKLILEKIKILIFSLLLILILSLILTFSRTAYLAFLIGWFSLLFLYLKQKEYFKIKNLIFVFLFFCFFVFIFKSFIFSRLDEDNRLENKSLSERVELNQEAINIIKNNLFFGVGIGNYEIYKFKKDDIKKPSWYYQPVHNLFFLVGAEIGLIGLTFFLIFWFFVLIKSYKINNLNIVLSLILFILAFFDHWLWSLHFGIMIFWLFLGVIIRECDFYKNNLPNLK